MGRYSGKTCRLVTMIALRGAAFLAEIVVFNMTDSAEVFGNALHMLADCIALVVGLTAVIVSIRLAFHLFIMINRSWWLQLLHVLFP